MVGNGMDFLCHGKRFDEILNEHPVLGLLEVYL